MMKFMFKTFFFSSLETPGSAWTKKEVDIVREKIKEMVNAVRRRIQPAIEDSHENDGTSLFVKDGTLSHIQTLICECWTSACPGWNNSGK